MNKHATQTHTLSISLSQPKPQSNFFYESTDCRKVFFFQPSREFWILTGNHIAGLVVGIRLVAVEREIVDLRAVLLRKVKLRAVVVQRCWPFNHASMPELMEWEEEKEIVFIIYAYYLRIYGVIRVIIVNVFGIMRASGSACLKRSYDNIMGEKARERLCSRHKYKKGSFRKNSTWDLLLIFLLSNRPIFSSFSVCFIVSAHGKPKNDCRRGMYLFVQCQACMDASEEAADRELPGEVFSDNVHRVESDKQKWVWEANDS